MIFATLPPKYSVNQRLPSGPATIHSGPLLAVMPARYSVTTPAGVIFATLPPKYSVNQRFTSGPAAIPKGLLPAVMRPGCPRSAGAAPPAADASNTIPSDTATNQRSPAATPPLLPDELWLLVTRYAFNERAL